MYLLDTNVVSELRKVGAGRADPKVAQWAESVETASLFVSVITIQELEIGIQLAMRRDSTQGELLRQWMNQHVLPAFEGRVLSVDLAVVQRSAALHVPNPRPVRDGLIAATALVHGLTVVTRNLADFQPCGVTLINPWG
ncbi:VapC Predicted nucleic acid-binding protein, contains PIN domain [Burkholderiaceae bacterium]